MPHDVVAQEAALETLSPGLDLSDVVIFSEGGARLAGPVDLIAPGGEWTVLLGRSGAGKSSILRAIAGLVPPERLKGAINAEDGAPLNGRIAWMAQDPLLAPWLSVQSNVAIGARFRGAPADLDAVDRALAAVGLQDYGARLPDSLSGGERQRVALARTLYEDRAIALLDEPFSALDALTRESASTLAAARLAGRTVLQVTHDPFEAARLADRALILGPKGDRIEQAPLGAAAAHPTPRDADAPETFELAAALRRALAAMEPDA